MRRRVTGVLVACFVAGSALAMATVPNKAACDAAKKALAQAQENFNKAWAKYVEASNNLDKAEAYEKSAEKALDANSAAQAGAQQDITNYTNQFSECRDRHPDSPCTTEYGRIENAKQRLQSLKDKVPELQLDLAQGKDMVSMAADANAAAHAAANAAKAELDKAAKAAAEACKHIA